MINRLILWLSLAGMILALHLWIQKARGFDQGCLGLSKPELVTEAGCQEVSDLPASHLLGVSNAAWGYAFYFGMAWLAVVKVFATERTARRLHFLSELGAVLALLYSSYLVYQMARAGVWCVLCLGSVACVTTLFGLHVCLRWRGGFTPITEGERAREFRGAVGAVLTAVGVLVAVLVFIDRLGTRSLDQGSSRREVERVVGQSLPIYIDAEKLREMRACHIDWEARPIDLAKFVGPSTPFLGRADGIPVLMFYDPNCGFCRNEYALFHKLAEKFKDRARFYVVPRVLWDHSVTQTAALKLAEPTGKYFELWKLMFERQERRTQDMSVAEIAALFRELGLDASDLEKRLAAARPAALALRDAGKAAGIDGIPAIYVNTRKVWTQNRSEECLSALIERRREAEKFPQ